MSVRKVRMSHGLAAALALASAGRAGAQAMDRGARPALPRPEAPRFPRVAERTLANGLRLLVVEDHSLPVVAVRLTLGVDSLLDPPGKEGLSALTTQMLGEGTATRSRDQLDAAMTSLGTQVT